LVMMVNEPSSAKQPFAWSAAVLDGYLWFSLKNPEDFPATLLWISNGGRSAAPWNSQHIGRISIEEVCSSFCHGVERSRRDHLTVDGIPTIRHFSRDEIVSLRMIHSVALVPDDFGAVIRIIPHDEGFVAIHGDSAKSIIVPVNWKYVI
ncbi:MAG: hypothetical protein H8M99_13515, partial [Gloeobacteraceae cyanobacterium ES-bin-144]|nr:hypothetical protein [Verrucomicrobiales bacterium]